MKICVFDLEGRWIDVALFEIVKLVQVGIISFVAHKRNRFTLLFDRCIRRFLFRCGFILFANVERFPSLVRVRGPENVAGWVEPENAKIQKSQHPLVAELVVSTGFGLAG